MPLDVNPFDFWGEGPDATVNPASTEPLPAWTQEVTPAVEAPAPVAAPESTDPLFTYKGTVDQLWSRFSTGADPAAPVYRNLADSSAPAVTSVLGGGPRPADNGDSIFKSIAKWFGFSDTPEGRNASSAAMTGLISAGVKGAADAVFGAPKRAAEIEKLQASSNVDRASAALINKKLENQSGMSGLALNPAPGLLGFRPAPIVPIKTRTA